MVPLAAQGSARASAQLDVDDEHAYVGDGYGTPCPDDIPF
jgi:hypothetical protein